MPIREITEHVHIDSIVPYFQPIIDLRQQRVWRYECLARLVTPAEQTFLPSEFLYLLERDNHAQRLTETMFTQSARYFMHSNLPWNINLNAADLDDEQVTNILLTLLGDYPNPSRVSVEVSAHAALEHTASLRKFIDKSLHSGLGVFIDNVGKTPVNINTLLALPVRGIKLAGELFSNYLAEPDVQDYVKHVCDCAKAKNITVIAEQIEDEETLTQVEKLGVNYAQGYVFCQPSPSVSH